MWRRDRAMYQAKALGKNQIAGYPRPRRAGLRPPPDPPAQEPPAAPAPEPQPEASSASTSTAFPVLPPRTNGTPSEAHGEDEPDPADMRRNIAAARRNMDPDHQISRAMDALLSSPAARGRDSD